MSHWNWNSENKIKSNALFYNFETSACTRDVCMYVCKQKSVIKIQFIERRQNVSKIKLNKDTLK